MGVQTILMQLISERYVLDAEKEITEDSDLIEDLELDSLEIFRLLTDVEEKFGIQFDDVDLLTENFVKIKDFVELIEREVGKNETQ